MSTSRRLRLGGLLADVLFPGRCLGCGRWMLQEEDPSIPVCGGCLALLPAIPGPRCERCGIDLVSERGTCMRCRSLDYRFHSHRSLFPYEGMAKCLLQELKFQGRTRLAAFFAGRIAYELKCHFKIEQERAVVVPVPPRPGRREADAVERTAALLASRHGLRVERLLLRRAATQQKKLSFEQRRSNLLGGITMAPGCRGNVPPRVVLLDDVFTTGATMDACAQALLASGCQRVDAITMVMEE